MSLFRLLQLTPTSWDLGIYTEYVKQLSLLHEPIVDVRGPGFNLLGDHFQVALAVLAPFLPCLPLACDAAVFPGPAHRVVGVPRHVGRVALAGRSSGRLIGFAYGFSWGLQQMIVFDFHEIALAVPLLAFSLSALVRRRPRAAALWALPLVFVKEDQGFTVAAIGLLLVLADLYPGWIPGPRRLRGHVGWGSLLFAWGLAWSVLAITVIIPHFNAAHDYYYFKDGGVVGGGPSFSVATLAGQAIFRLFHQAHDRGTAAARHGVRRGRLAGRAARAAKPGAQVRLDEHRVLGHGLALQRDDHADPLHRRDRGDRPLA